MSIQSSTELNVSKPLSSTLLSCNTTVSQINRAEHDVDRTLDIEKSTLLKLKKLITKNNLKINILNESKDYFTTNEYNNLLVSNHANLTIFSLNINSLNKHNEDLSCFLSLIDYQFDIIILTEIRKNNYPIQNTFLNKYNKYVDLPEDSKHGGVAIFIK